MSTYDDDLAARWSALAEEVVTGLLAEAEAGRRKLIQDLIRENGLEKLPGFGDLCDICARDRDEVVLILATSIFNFVQARVFHGNWNGIECAADLERLTYVIWAYRNRAIASRLHPSLPNKPGMDSANSIGTLLAGSFDRDASGMLHIPEDADLVLAGRRWLTRLRRRLEKCRAELSESDREMPADAFVKAILPLLPNKAGRPISPR